jgi:hypothetical protein
MNSPFKRKCYASCVRKEISGDVRKERKIEKLGRREESETRIREGEELCAG